MPRTFSLRLLLTCITLFCIFCAFVNRFPQAANVCVVLLSLFAPTAVVWFVLVRFSMEPIILTFSVVSGATVFFVLTMLLLPGVFYFGPVPDFMAISIPPAVGAFMFGVMTLATEVAPQREDQ